VSVHWPRLGRAAGSLACAGALAAYPALEATRLPWLQAALGIAACATLAVGLARRRSQLFVWALALLGADYAVWLELGTHALDQRAPVVGAGFLLAAELAFDSLEPELGPITSTAAISRAIALTVVLLASVGVDALVLGATSIPVGGGIALTVLGVVAAVVALALITRLAAERR
jgi:hypothetical protein